MARSTDGRSRRLWPSVLVTLCLAVFAGMALAQIIVQGPSVTNVVLFIAMAGIALAEAYDATRICLARAHTPDARASYPDKPPARLPAAALTTENPHVLLLHMSRNPSLYEDADWLVVLGRVCAMERTIATFRDEAKFVRTGGDEEVTEVQLVRLPDGFEQLLVDLHREAYDACYNTRPNASWLAVGDALEAVLDAAAVPARAMRRPRGQFIPVRN